MKREEDLSGFYTEMVGQAQVLPRAATLVGCFLRDLFPAQDRKEGKKSEKGGSYHPHNHYCSSSSKQESKTVVGKYLEWSLHRNMNSKEKLQWTLGTRQTFSHWGFCFALLESCFSCQPKVRSHFLWILLLQSLFPEPLGNAPGTVKKETAGWGTRERAGEAQDLGEGRPRP